MGHGFEEASKLPSSSYCTWVQYHYLLNLAELELRLRRSHLLNLSLMIGHALYSSNVENLGTQTLYLITVIIIMGL